MAATMMAKSYLHGLGTAGQIPASSFDVLEASGARSPEAILSLLRAFPTLAHQGLVDFPALSNVVMKTASSAATNAVVAATAAGTPMGILRRAPSASGYGARAPSTARWKPTQTVPVPPPGFAANAVPTSGSSLPAAAQIDARGCLPWPVRDQGSRGTCVAFATTALRELLMCEQTASLQDAAEQFLYWDIKTNSGDPQKNVDGTWIEFAFESLARAGICPELNWPYNPTLNKANISHGGPGAPPPGAVTQAAIWACPATTHQSVSATSGNAQNVLNELITHRRPLAISLPVFSDPAFLEADNWTTPAGWLWGVVLDPPPTSVVVGGHCVCVTGFESDSTEPLGGYFIIRNSWSSQWGSQLPLGGYHGPEAGYGQVSATYVDRFLWEYGQL